jgi:UTP:GlnB (protein PII) uridylyltransferase
VTRALASLGLDIHSAKITSWAGRAEDAFYVTRRNATMSMLLNDGTDDDASTSTENAAASVRDQKISDDENQSVWRKCSAACKSRCQSSSRAILRRVAGESRLK